MYIYNVMETLFRSRAMNGSNLRVLQKFKYALPTNFNAQFCSKASKLWKEYAEKSGYQSYGEFEINYRRSRTKPVNFIPKKADVEHCVKLYYNVYRNMSTIIWDELITFLIDLRPHLAHELNRCLIQYAPKDPEEQAFMAKRFELEYDALSKQAKDVYNSNMRHYYKTKTRNYHYKLPPEMMNKHKFVRRAEDFTAMIECLKKENLIAISTKKVSFANTPKECAILQIATPTNAFIINSYKRKRGDEKFWKALADQIFDNGNITKLIFGNMTHLYGLQTLMPQWSGNTEKYINIQLLYAYLNRYTEFKFNNITRKRYSHNCISLSNLTAECFGSSLNQTESLSVWLNQPLRRAQLEFAISEVYLMIQIFLHIKQSLGDESFDVHIKQFLKTRKLVFRTIPLE